MLMSTFECVFVVIKNESFRNAFKMLFLKMDFLRFVYKNSWKFIWLSRPYFFFFFISFAHRSCVENNERERMTVERRAEPHTHTEWERDKRRGIIHIDLFVAIHFSPLDWAHVRRRAVYVSHLLSTYSTFRRRSPDFSSHKSKRCKQLMSSSPNDRFKLVIFSVRSHRFHAILNRVRQRSPFFFSSNWIEFQSYFTLHKRTARLFKIEWRNFSLNNFVQKNFLEKRRKLLKRKKWK